MKNRASRLVRRAVMAAGLVAFGFTAVADSLPPNAYIPTGLLYHWDGVDNQATGTHDPNAATWVDRVGKVALTKSGTVTVEDDGMVFNGSSYFTRGNGTFPADSVFPWTTEVHFKVNNVSADFHVLGTNGSGGWTFLQEKGYFTFAPCHKGFTVFSGNGYVFAQSPQLKAGDQLTATGINQKPSVQIWRDGVFSAKYEDTVATSYNHNGVSTVPFTIGTSGGNGNRLKGKVFCARIYDRVLKPVEIAYNSAVDRVRFQGVSIADAQFPAGIRFNEQEDRVEFCQAVAFDAAKGSVSADGEEIAPGPIAWYPYGTTVEGTVTLTATGKAGCLFGRWVGVPDGVDATSATITLPKNEAAGLTAEFILPAGAYVQRGLIYHWDGIDNQADGTYHPNATTWVDLVQGITLTQDTRETSSSPKTDAKFDPAGYGAIFAKKASCFAHTQPLPGAVFPFSTEVCFETHERSDRNQHVIGTNGSGGWTFLQSGTTKFSFVPYYNGDYRWADGQARPVNDVVTAYGSSEASLIALYTNGVFEAQTAVSGAYNNGSQNFRIGTSGSSANGLVGKIYASRIYDHVLTAGEVLFNANIDRMRFQNADAAELTWPEGVTYEDGQFWAEVRVTFDASKGTLAVGDIALESGALTKVPLELGGVVTVTATLAEGYRLIGFTGDEAAKVDFAAQTAKVSPLACNELTANFIAVTKVEDANGVTAKSYVQDGLLAMWDGIENVGNGYHSNEADFWKNLSEEGSVWDMKPTDYTRNEGGTPYYTWYDNSCYIFEPSGKGSGGDRSRFLVNHADSSIMQMEVAAKPTQLGTLVGTNPDGYTWVFADINNHMFVKTSDSNSPFFGEWTKSKFYSHSATLGSSIAVYRNGEQMTSTGNGRLDLSITKGTSIIGGMWTTAHAYLYNTRFYSKTLTDGERKLNYLVDCVRYDGADYAATFCGTENTDIPAFVVSAGSARFGNPSVGYGVTAYAGAYEGSVTMSGEVEYSDGVTAYPGADDPEHVRAYVRGGTVSVGGGEPVAFTGSAAPVSASGARVDIVWDFEPECWYALTAGEGGKVSFGEGEVTSSLAQWGKGDTVTLTAIPDEGSAFLRWTGDTDGLDVGRASLTIANDRARTLTATFIQAQRVVSPGGISAKSYVQDGLLAMWDGIENVGAGYHSNEADFWRNLSDEGAVWDMAPNSQAVGFYTWSDNYLQVKSNPNFGSSAQGGAFAVNKTDTSTKQMEMAATQVNDGGMAATSPNGAAWVFGTFNYVFWIKQNYYTIYSVPSKAFHSFSLDMVNYRPETTKWALYMDGAPAATLTGEKQCGGLGVPSGETRVGNFYNASNSKVHNYRLYSKALSEAERKLNWDVDQVRFNGADFKATFAGDDSADVPAVVVLGNTYPNAYGVSSQGYGVNPFAGSFSGTVTLSGEREYEDGVTALPDAANPDRKRAVCTGYSLKLGDGEAMTGEETSVTVPETAGRVLVEWQFVEQFHLMATAGAGGKVKLGDGELSASVDTWAASGANVRLTAVADEGYVFQGWAGDVEGFDDRAAAVAVPNDRVRTLTAVFVKATRVVSQDGFTAKSYVRRGLVAQWDGKENVAYGAFDDKATYWRQLIGQSGHHDLYPNDAVKYSWVDDALLVDDSVTGAMFTNDATTVIGAVECNASLSANAVFWSSKEKSEPTYHLLGYANSYFYINSTGDGYDFSDLTHQHTYSADFTGARALYVDDVKKGTKGTCGLGAAEGITQLGRVYSSGKPKVRSLRYYAEPLTAAERRINYGIDQVRFHGQGVVETFGSPLYDDVPIIVVAGNPVCNGVSSVPYGITVYDGPSTNVGKVVLSGSRIYEDGRIGFPGAFDPERSRALYQGGRYRVGNSMWHDFALGCQECDIGTLTGRAVIEWRFGLAEVRTDIQAKEGGSVRFADGSGLTSRWSGIDTVLKVVAEPSDGYIFHHWEVDGQPLADNRNPVQTFVADGGRTMTAVFARGQQLSWNSYVQHGLAAQYDGEFNAIDANGTPYHDPAATTWKQLVTTSVAADATVNGNKSLEEAQISWGEKSANFAGSGQFIVKGISSTPKSETNSWFGGACARAARGIEGVSTEYCALLHDGRENAYHVRTANGTVYSIGTSYSSNDKGTECMSMYLCNRNLSSMYATSRSTNEWDLSYSLNVQPDDRLFRFYRNGKLKKAQTAAAVDNYYSDTYLQYFLFGRKTLDMHAFRVYTNTLDKYEIRWNSTVDRVRFLGGHPGDVTIDMAATALGTCVPAAGSSTVLQHGDTFTATLTPTAAVETYDDGVVAQPVSDAERLAVGWRMLAGGPVPAESKGNGLTVSFTATNVLSQIDWTTNTQYRTMATALPDEDGQVHGTFAIDGEGVVVTQGAQTKWSDAGGTVKLVATPEEGYRVKAWTITTAAGTVTRRKAELTFAVDGPVTVTVEFEKKLGLRLIVR